MASLAMSTTTSESLDRASRATSIATPPSLTMASRQAAFQDRRLSASTASAAMVSSPLPRRPSMHSASTA
eukprot:scaffold965_cov262-Pinguiococcus_pyrenoidosus.AAC.6